MDERLVLKEGRGFRVEAPTDLERRVLRELVARAGTPMIRNGFFIAPILVLGGALLITACGEDDFVEADGEWYGELCGGEVGELGEIGFQPCRAQGLEMECARVSAPLDWCDQGSEAIELFVRRLRTSVVPAAGQVWLLNGGPGFPGDPLLGTVSFFLEQGLDVYLPDYRGVGQSTDLNCIGYHPGGLDQRCMSELLESWGDGLHHFNTTQTAIDLAQLIERLRVEDENVFLWSNSYGTFLANRYLSLFPSRVSGVVLDGLCPASGCDVRKDRNFDLLVRRVFDYCGEDPNCSAKLSANPVQRLEALFDAVRGGHCHESFGNSTEAVLKEILTLAFSDKTTIAMGLAFMHRLDRCDPLDVVALKRVVYGPDQGRAAFGIAGSNSSYLFYNVVFAEFWDEVLTPEKAAEEAEGFLWNPGTTGAMARLRDAWTWPIDRTPEDEKHWAETDTPLLIVNGTLDPQTTVEGLLGIEEVFTHPAQSFVPIPWAGHLTLFSASLEAEREDPCVGSLVREFFQDPSKAPDTSCIDSLVPPDLGSNPKMAEYFFGTTDIWENEEPAAVVWSSEAPRSFPTLDELRERLRRAAAWSP